ncbi:MAG: glycoside hydrolase family 5 protein [Oscillospiraceae bacterium]|jgi:endoglucanase
MQLLQVKNGTIVKEDGSPILLRGTCVGGWMNLEDFINGYPGTETGIRKWMREILGETTGRYFFERMIDNFFGEDDIAFIASTGANVVRLPLSYRHFEDDMNPFVYKEEGFRRLDEIVALCEKYNLYVILDMHAVPGWQNCHWHSDNERGASLFWTHKHFQDRLVGLWQEFARRYEGKAVIAGYNLMNEPSSSTPNGEHPFDFYANYRSDWATINAVYRRLVNAIREIDPKHILFLEGDNYSRKFEGLDAPFDGNLVYSSHNYTAPGFGPGDYPGLYDGENGPTYWDRNRHKRVFLNEEGTRFARKYKVPLWVGEFGSQYHGPAEQVPDRLRSMDDQLSVYNELGVHWTTWTYKDAGVMGWVTLNPDCEYLQIVAATQEMKRTLGAENFVAHYGPICPGRAKSRELADLLLDGSGNSLMNHADNAFLLNYAALTGYAAALIQPSYAKRFAGMTETEIDRVMQAFAFKNCLVNERYLELLKRRIAE